MRASIGLIWEANSVPDYPLCSSRDSHPRSLCTWLSSCALKPTPLRGPALIMWGCDLLPDPTKEGLKLNQLKFAGQRRVG